MKIPGIVFAVVLVVVGIMNIIFGSIIYLSLKKDDLSTKMTNSNRSASGVFWVGVILLILGLIQSYVVYKGVDYKVEGTYANSKGGDRIAFSSESPSSSKSTPSTPSR